MKSTDAFQFKSFEGRGPMEHNHNDHTPHDDDIPKEFRIEEPAPPPFDVDAAIVNNDAAMDLIAWAFDQIA